MKQLSFTTTQGAFNLQHRDDLVLLTIIDNRGMAQVWIDVPLLDGACNNDYSAPFGDMHDMTVHFQSAAALRGDRWFRLKIGRLLHWITLDAGQLAHIRAWLRTLPADVGVGE